MMATPIHPNEKNMNNSAIKWDIEKNNFTTLYEFKFFNSLAIKNQRYKFVKKSYPSYMYDVP